MQHRSHGATRTQQEVRETQHYRVVPEAEANKRRDPSEMPILQMLGFQALEVSHFRHWNMLLREVKDLSLGTFKRHGCGP